MISFIAAKTPNFENWAGASIDPKPIELYDMIDNYRPFFSLITGHSRVCQGYLIQNGYTYLYINDPEPVGSNGTPKIERTYGSREIKRVYVRN